MAKLAVDVFDSAAIGQATCSNLNSSRPRVHCQQFLDCSKQDIQETRGVAFLNILLEFFKSL
jgi:hypothetical protein